MMPRRWRKETPTEPHDDSESSAATFLTPTGPTGEHLRRTADIARGIKPAPRPEPRPTVVEVVTPDGSYTIASVEDVSPDAVRRVVGRIRRNARSQ